MSNVILVGGYITSPPDDRDWPLEKLVPYGASVPQPYDLPWVAPLEDQGPSMMCVDYSIRRSTMEAEYQQRGGTVIDLAHGFIFSMRKSTDFQGEGLILREALVTATRMGIPRRNVFDFVGKYEDGRKLLGPYLEGEGLSTRMKGFVTLKNLTDVYNFLVRFKYSALIGLTLYESFLQTGSDGIIPPPSGAIIGGHGMSISGLVMKNGRLMLKIPNTWGPNWGDHGWGYLDLSQHVMYEMWGPIAEDTGAMFDRPREVMLTLGSKTMFIGSDMITLPFAPFIEKASGSAAVPLRAIGEAFKVKVEWYPGVPGVSSGRIILRDGGEYETLDKVN